MIRRSNILLSSIVLVFIVSCASVPRQNPSNASQTDHRRILESTPQAVEEKLPDFRDIQYKIKDFRSRLATGTSLTPQDWQLHDQLLQAYIDLQSMPAGNVVAVPAHSRKKIHLQTFCLNPGIPAPVTGEKFVWKTDSTEIPYLKQIIAYGVSHPEIAQSRFQELIWNLKKGARWEHYPQDMQRILSSIDPQANLKLPSQFKDQMGAKAKSYTIDKLKEWGLWQQGEKLANEFKNQYDDIAKIQRDLQNLKSNYPLGPPGTLASIPGTPLYADTRTYGYNSHDVIFYNPTDQPVSIDLTHYYMQSTRPDVQRMALKKEILPEDQRTRGIRELEDTLYGDMLRVGIGFVPIAGDAADIYELLEGKDFISGQELTWQGRLLSGVGLIAGSGAGYRYALRAVYAPNQYISAFENELSKVSGKTVMLSPRALNDAKTFISDSNQEATNLKRILPNEELRQSGFTGIFTNEKRFGYHATTPSAAGSIKKEGFIQSSKGRLGGQGVYVNDSREGAIAEYRYHNPDGPEPDVLKVEYDSGLEYKVKAKQDEVSGGVSVKADTLTTESIRAPGTYNSIIRNNSERIVQ